MVSKWSKPKLPLDLLVEQLKKDLRGNSFIYDHKTPLICNSKEKTSTLVGCGLSERKIFQNDHLSGRRSSTDHFKFVDILRFLPNHEAQQKHFTSCVQKRYLMVMILLIPKQLTCIKITIFLIVKVHLAENKPHYLTKYWLWTCYCFSANGCTIATFPDLQGRL